MFNKSKLKNLLNQNLNDTNLNSINYVDAAVLIILFYKHNDIHVLLTERTNNVKTHKGQISFPGGLYKNTDKLMVNTAIRETYEEIGITSNNFEILGKLDNVKTIEENFLITPYVSYAKNLEPDDKALGNLSARIRKNIIYYYANAKNLTVLGTSDKTEHLIGYFTKFGDGAADLLPISSLYKNQVRGLAKYLGVSDSIIKKKSSPNLWKNHFAEIELDASYEQIDCVLYCIFDEKISIDETVKRTAIDKNTVEKIYNLYKKSKHKRITPEML